LPSTGRRGDVHQLEPAGILHGRPPRGRDPWALAGSAGILAGAALGGSTMFAALKEAKAHGARKKLAAVDARKRARAGEPPRAAP